MTTAHNVRDYFHSVSGTYFDRYFEDTPAGYAVRVRQARVFEMLGNGPGNLLDVGCGPGVMVQTAREAGFDYWGTDFAPGMIAECRRRFPGLPQARFHTGSVTDLPHSTASFDALICIGVIDRIPEYRRAIAEMMRVLKPGGTAVIAFPNARSPYAWWRKSVFYPAVAAIRPLYCRLTGRPSPPVLDSFVKLYTLPEVTSLIRSAAGKVAEVTYFNFNLLLSPWDELLPKLAVRLASLCEPLRQGPLRSLGSGFLVKVRKT